MLSKGHSDTLNRYSARWMQLFHTEIK